jgi:hypothetical protein
MLISISSLANADEENENETENLEIDEDTEKEIQIMNNSLGKEIRLLQLQKALYKNLLKGEMAVEVLEELDFNTTSLKEILAEMKILLNETIEANTSSNDSVQIFIEFKKEAKNLTKQFRETIKDLLDDVKLREIRNRIKENITNEEFQNLSKWIRNRIKQFNRNQIYRLYGIIGAANNSFVNEYLNDNISLNQIKLQLNKIINQKTKENKNNIFSQIKEENIKKKINAHISLDNIKNKGKGNSKGKGVS